MWKPGAPKPSSLKSSNSPFSKSIGKGDVKKKALSKNVLGLKFMTRKRDAAAAAQQAQKRRRAEESRKWTMPPVIGANHGKPRRSLRRSDETDVPAEHIINGRRSFGNFNKVTEDNHEFLKRQFKQSALEEDANTKAIGDEEMAAFFARSKLNAAERNRNDAKPNHKNKRQKRSAS